MSQKLTPAQATQNSISITPSPVPNHNIPVVDPATGLPTKHYHRYFTNQTAGTPPFTFSWVESVLYATTSQLQDMSVTSGVYNNGTNGVGATLTFIDVLNVNTVDGITPAVGDRILVKDQTIASNPSTQNGIYDVTSINPAILTRSTDYNGSDTGQILEGSSIYIKTGFKNATAYFTQQTFDTPSGSQVGVDAITFAPSASQMIFTVDTAIAANKFAVLGRIAASSPTGNNPFTLYFFDGTAWRFWTASPSGAAFGDLSGTYPSPTVAKINGATLGSTTATAGNLLIGSGSQWVTHAVSGDGTLASTGALTVTATNGVSFAASATTDTTNAANISSGTLPAARLPNPSSSTLGGIESLAAVTSKWINTISTAGVPSATQPAYTDISGTVPAVTSVATSGLATGGTITSTGTVTVTAAVKSDQTTGTSTTVAVVPAIQQNHESAAKVTYFGTLSAGVLTTAYSYGVSSATRTSAGLFVINFTTAFTTANYSPNCNLGSPAPGAAFAAYQINSASACQVRCANIAYNANVDPVNFSFQAFGTQ